MILEKLYKQVFCEFYFTSPIALVINRALIITMVLKKIYELTDNTVYVIEEVLFTTENRRRKVTCVLDNCTVNLPFGFTKKQKIYFSDKHFFRISNGIIEFPKPHNGFCLCPENCEECLCSSAKWLCGCILHRNSIKINNYGKYIKKCMVIEETKSKNG